MKTLFWWKTFYIELKLTPTNSLITTSYEGLIKHLLELGLKMIIVLSICVGNILNWQEIWFPDPNMRKTWDEQDSCAASLNISYALSHYWLKLSWIEVMKIKYKRSTSFMNDIRKSNPRKARNNILKYWGYNSSKFNQIIVCRSVISLSLKKKDSAGGMLQFSLKK